MTPAPPSQRSSALLSLFFGGLLPVIAFSVIEDQYGPLWGTVAGMIFGIGELIFEKVRYGKIAAITWIGNLMILGLGGISIISNEGIWFKLQPALLEAFFALFLWGSWLVKNPLLLIMAQKQGTQIPEVIKPAMSGMTFRTGIFFAIHGAIATWAAFSWTTAQWAFLKGFGLTITFFLYMGMEIYYLRLSLQKRKEPSSDGSFRETEITSTQQKRP